MFVQSTVIKYGDRDFDTDGLSPPATLNTIDHAESLPTAWRIRLSDFAKKRPKRAGIIVAGRNFGCGLPWASMRRRYWRQRHSALRHRGQLCPTSRNSIDIGLPIIECPGEVAESHS